MKGEREREKKREDWWKETENDGNIPNDYPSCSSKIYKKD